MDRFMQPLAKLWLRVEEGFSRRPNRLVRLISHLIFESNPDKWNELHERVVRSMQDEPRLLADLRVLLHLKRLIVQHRDRPEPRKLYESYFRLASDETLVARAKHAVHVIENKSGMANTLDIQDEIGIVNRVINTRGHLFGRIEKKVIQIHARTPGNPDLERLRQVVENFKNSDYYRNVIQPQRLEHGAIPGIVADRLRR